MSRSGYCDDEYDWNTIRWRGAVASAIRGKRGQSFLLEMWKAMQNLPVKALIKGELEDTLDQSVSHWGLVEVPAVCAIGAVGKARGVDMSNIDPDDHEAVAAAFGIPHSLACEIMYMNDEWRREDPEARFARMKKWIEENLLPVEAT